MVSKIGNIVVDMETNSFEIYYTDGQIKRMNQGQFEEFLELFRVSLDGESYNKTARMLQSAYIACTA